jgi:hypothetical protein
VLRAQVHIVTGCSIVSEEISIQIAYLAKKQMNTDWFKTPRRSTSADSKREALPAPLCSQSMPASFKYKHCVMLHAIDYDKKKPVIVYAAESFEKLMLSSIVMDKTPFVSTFMDLEKFKFQYRFILLPRKSGKSTMLHCICYFVEDRGLFEAYVKLHLIWVCLFFFSPTLKMG